MGVPAQRAGRGAEDGAQAGGGGCCLEGARVQTLGSLALPLPLLRPSLAAPHLPGELKPCTSSSESPSICQSPRAPACPQKSPLPNAHPAESHLHLFRPLLLLCFFPLRLNAKSALLLPPQLLPGHSCLGWGALVTGSAGPPQGL